MVRRVSRIVSIALALLAAGCQGIPPAPETPSPAPTTLPLPTATPSPVPATPTSTSPPPSPTPTPASTVVSPAATPTSQAPTPTSTSQQDRSGYIGAEHQGGILGGVWTLADVRSGSHPDKLRLVIEMSEPADTAPFFKVVEVDNAASPFPTGHDPSWGAARIDVIVSDLYARDFPLEQRLPTIPPDSPLVTRVGVYPTFSDAHLGFSIGLKRPAPFRVYELRKPVRIVIDVLYSE